MSELEDNWLHSISDDALQYEIDRACGLYGGRTCGTTFLWLKEEKDRRKLQQLAEQ